MIAGSERPHTSPAGLKAVLGSPFSAEFGGSCSITVKALTAVAVDPTGKFAYVANQGGTVSAYTIDPSTGALTAITGSLPRKYS